MELSRPDSFGQGGTVWKQSGIEQEASAAHHGSPMRWSWTYGSGGWVEQRRLGSTVDDRAGTSALRTLHCCRNRVGSKRMHAPRWAVHYGSTSDAQREYDGGGRNKPVKVWWCDTVIPHRQFLVMEETEIPRDRIRHHRIRDVEGRHSVTFPELWPSLEPPDVYRTLVCASVRYTSGGSRLVVA